MALSKPKRLQGWNARCGVITYDETGKKPKSEEHYIAGERDGVWKAWYANGQQKPGGQFQKRQTPG